MVERERSRPDRGRVVIGMVGLDQHEVGALAVSQLLVRAGFEVVYLGAFNTAASLVAAAIEEDADVVGVSAHSWEFDGHVDALVEQCHDAGIAVVVGGSVLTETDRAKLGARGVDAVFLAYAAEDDIVSQLDRLVGDRRLGRAGESSTPLRSMPLAGRVIAVTGAARGLGRSYVDLLTVLGADVVANDIDDEALAELGATPIGSGRDPQRGTISSVAADVAASEGVDAIIATAIDSYGRLDGLVANAGLLRSGPILRLTADDVDTVLAVHVRGTFLLARAAGAYWRAEAREGRPVQGSIVTTTSSAGLYGFRAEAIYSAAKAAIAAFTIVAADEFARFGVTVNAVAPVARTRLTAWLADPDPAGDPLDAANVAPLVAWLVGPDSADVTGRVFEAGGGNVSVASGWTHGAEGELTAFSSQTDVDAVVRRLLAAAPLPTPIVTAT